MNNYPQGYETFYTHDFIKSIANNEKWAISDINKRPIDLKYLKKFNQIKGVSKDSLDSLPTLQQSLDIIPNPANHAYYLDALIDDFLILDIEPKCPENIKEELLKLPYIYGETSLSGKGYHLIFPIPSNFTDNPYVQTKTVIQEQHGYYEILLNHWVTFTRHIIEPSDIVDQTSFETFFADFTKDVKKTKDTSSINIEDNFDKDTINNFDTIINALSNVKYHKKLSDFEDNHSKYEFGYVAYHYDKLKKITNLKHIQKEHDFTNNDLAWILYTYVKENLEYRPKHDTYRNKLPWLLYLCKTVIEKNN